MKDIFEITKIPEMPLYDGVYIFNKIPKNDLIGNSHGHHKYPAKFIPQFPKWALNRKKNHNNLTVLDPFCGSGTTLIEAGVLGATSIGVDISDVAIIISKAKTTVLDKNNSAEYSHRVKNIVSLANKKYLDIKNDFDNSFSKECHNMDKTWSTWFDSESISKIVSIRYAIQESEKNELYYIYLSVLSSIVKKCSYLDENQVKVKKIYNKSIPEVYNTYINSFEKFILEHLITSQKLSDNTPIFNIFKASATDTGIEKNTVDLIVTSPPYINAIDYTMAHKYSMFALGLIKPCEFKDHCREYIGVTERAVRVSDYNQIIKFSGNEYIDGFIRLLREQNTTTSLNRSYVVWQYFTLMHEFFLEMERVMKHDGEMVFVVGESNNICGIEIPTANLLESLAINSGLHVKNKFYHVINNRSGMRLNRNSSGGSIKSEVVFSFGKK
ncbi:DNA methylase [compost metagenome]